MTDRAVHIKLIEIRSLLGIRPGAGFDLSDLSPGINVVHGPNGSGKSTAALALQELLWPGRTGLERQTLSGRFVDGDSDWKVEIDAGHVEAVCDGRSGLLPEFGPAEDRSRYHLALHDLIRSRNSSFAKRIADESQGGFDLESAAAGLDFTDKPSKPLSQVKDLEKARMRARGARSRQEEARSGEDSIPALQARHEAAKRNAAMIEILRKADEHAEAREVLRDVEIRLGALPSEIAGLKGDERRRLDEIDEHAAELDKERQAELDRIAAADRELDELDLPTEGVKIETIAPLEAARRKLKDIETERARQEQDLSKAREMAKKARMRLGGHLSDEQLGGLERVEYDDLNRFAGQADQVRAKNQVLRERRLALAGDVGSEVECHTGEKIREGIAALARWLASTAPGVDPRPRAHWTALAGAGFAFVLGIVLAVVHHWAWLSAALAASVLALLVRLRRADADDRSAADTQAVHRQSYLETGLEPPEPWETAAVSARLRSLVDLSVARAVEDDRQRRLDTLQHDEAEFEKAQDELERVRLEIEDRLGLKIEIADAWLPLLVDNIGQWQVASSEVDAIFAALDGLEGRAQAQTKVLDTGLVVFGYEPIYMAETAAKYIEDLKDRRTRHAASRKDKTDAESKLTDTIKPKLDRIAGERLDLFRNAGLGPEDESRLDALLDKYGTYTDLETERAVCETRLEDRCQALAGLEDLLDLSRDEIEARIESLKPSLNERDELMEQIGAIRKTVSDLKGGHDLSDALADMAAAEAVLADARDRSDGAVAGAQLMTWVRRTAIERSRPHVFSRAAELVARFSRYTLDLDLDDQASPPEFRVRRGNSAPASVETLSVGERVQLLAAIRLAFLETSEQTMLPLLLDETLGTSDDSRAAEIIDCIIEIAREGRQVFYFTAQDDEVGKWRARLEGGGIASRVFDLSRIRKEAVAATTPLERWSQEFGQHAKVAPALQSRGQEQ